MSLRILHISSELSPYAKTGGLADVAAALPIELARAGHDVRILLPDYAAATSRPELVPLDAGPVKIAAGNDNVEVTLSKAPDGNGPVLYFLHSPALYDTPGIYSEGPFEAQRYLALCHSTLMLLEALQWQPDIIHCHDWHAAAIPALLNAGGTQYAGIRTLLTIHNIGYQGVYPKAAFNDDELAALGVNEDGYVNLLGSGIRDAGWLTTVSPTHAAEICTPAYGMGLENALTARKAELTGILNGADYRQWDPAHDALIPARFDATDRSGKYVCKASLVAQFGLDPDPAKPLVGCVSRLAEQKGIDFIIAVLPDLLAARAINCVMLGDGDPQLATLLSSLAERYPAQFEFTRGYDEALSHRIHAGSDLFLVPSRYEPCGLTQMYAMRYGTIPVVRETGGLADTVQHFNPDDRSGTGSLFKNADAQGLRWALGEALGWFQDVELREALISNAMAADFSWARQVQPYIALYERLAGQPA